MIGIRLAPCYAKDVSVVSASVVVETLVTVAVKLALAMLGLAILCIILNAAHGLSRIITSGPLMSLPLPCVFAVALRGAPFRRLEAMACRWIGKSNALVMKLDGNRLDYEIRSLLRRTSQCARAFAWEFFSYVTGALEAYLGLAMLGHPVSIAGAVAMESLTRCLRSAFFIMPARLRIQEVAIVKISGAFGIDREAAL